MHPFPIHRRIARTLARAALTLCFLASGMALAEDAPKAETPCMTFKAFIANVNPPVVGAWKVDGEKAQALIAALNSVPPVTSFSGDAINLFALMNGRAYAPIESHGCLLVAANGKFPTLPIPLPLLKAVIESRRNTGDDFI